MLAALDNELTLLDRDTFLKFVQDTPLVRGRSFSALLGLARLSEFRQALEVLANPRNLKSDFELDLLEGSVETEGRFAVEAAERIRSSFRSLTDKEAEAVIEHSAISDTAFGVLTQIPILDTVLAGKDFETLDFAAIRAAIKNAEAGDQRERLGQIVRQISNLEQLRPRSQDDAEQEELGTLIAKRDTALETTRGPLFKQLYSVASQIFSEGQWTDPLQCLLCESSLPEPLPPHIDAKLRQYQHALEAESAIVQSWGNSLWVSRLKSLEAADPLELNPAMLRFQSLDHRFRHEHPTPEDLRLAVDRLKELDSLRATALQRLADEKASTEAALPPSLVSLTLQVEYAEQLQKGLRAYKIAQNAQATAAKTLKSRKRWADFVMAAEDLFSKAEVKLSTAKTIALETRYRAMHEQITNNPEVVPALKKDPNSGQLFLRLANFYGLTDLSAATLLPESYRNALAISIYLSTALETKSTARFMVLDDVTSSFDAGHQYALMELIRTRIAFPVNPDGPQIIILSHDGLLEKYFDKLAASTGWHHQRLQGLPPRGFVLSHTQDLNRLEQSARKFLLTGQTELAEPLVRQTIEQKLLQIIRRVEIPVPLDFSIRDDRKMVGNCLDSISSAIDLHKRAGDLILTASQIRDAESVHVPALVANWVNHYATLTGASLSPYVLIGVLDTISRFSECFMYNCNCQGPVKLRFYRNLGSKACSC
jgi:hypothetical protein